MKNEIISKINQSIGKTAVEADEAFAAIQSYVTRKQAALNNLAAKLPELEKVLTNLGLAIFEVNYAQTGNHPEGQFKWEENDALRITVSAAPASKKFRFLTFTGYDSTGRGRNQKGLDAKAANLEQIIYQATQLQVHVNPFSLEVRSNQDLTTRYVLIEFRIA